MELELGQLVKLKPVEGKVIINPATRKPMPKDGVQVVVTVYWFRRFKDGDVLLAEAEPVEKETKRAGKSAVANKKETSEG